MAHPQTAPCVNINDETVQVVGVNVKEGDFVRAGAVVAAVETDKSLVDVVAERDGYVLKVVGQPGQKVLVGSVLLWLGETAGEPVPEAHADALPAAAAGAPPTAKARAMLKELGLDAARIAATGERLTVADIEAWLAREGAGRVARPDGSAPATPAEPLPDVPGEPIELSSEATGMLRTVQWHRDHAAAAYLELEYDPAPWAEHASRHAAEHKLMLSPLLPLMARRLVALAGEHPAINATIARGKRYQYRPVNLGFTVQAGPTLYLAVVRDAQAMSAAEFIDALGQVQRVAMAHKLRPDQASGATLSFSSMARWNVSRHIPILPPQTSLIVAHAAPRNAGGAVLGASYDHRVLSGFEVAQVLQALSRPAA
jgi:pyruvate/2-oxoglutarate dehydrogenase complex dihydrolipoamide acyltransferase (E2) component